MFNHLWLSVVNLSILLCIISPTYGAESVPVLTWGASSEDTDLYSPLNRINSEDFSHLIRSRIHSHTFVAVFIEENLSTEDLSRKDDDGNTQYPNLKMRVHDNGFSYLPSVENPLYVLNKIAEPVGIDHVEMTDEGLSADILPGPGKFLYIELKDALEGEDRFKMLYRHDRFINEMYEKLLKKHRNVLAIYTSRHPSWEIFPERESNQNPSWEIFSEKETARFKRHLLQQTSNDIEGFYNVSNKIYLYAPKIKIVDNEKVETYSTGDFSSYNENGNTVSAVLKLENYTITFSYNNVNGYWNLGTTLNNTEGISISLTSADVGAPLGFSYHCGQSVKYKTNKNNLSYVLEFIDFQTQPFFSKEPRNGFDSPYDCVGVMTVPIWSGLAVVTLLLVILSGGIMMMMDIRTMDRFDDPKGKTITINASE